MNRPFTKRIPTLLRLIAAELPIPPSRRERPERGNTTRLAALLVFVLIATSSFAAPRPLEAQDTDDTGWSNAAELSFVVSGGNSGGSTLGVRNQLRRITETGEWRLNASAIRTDATRITRFAEGSGPDDFVVREETETERTAERYSADTRYDLNLAEHFFAFGGLGWTRNTFAGFRNRTVASLGAGNQWGPGEESWVLKLGYGLTYTAQDDLAPDPDVPDAFAGARVTLDHLQQLTEGTTAEVAWVVDANTERGEDVRGDFTQSVGAALNSFLSLKTTFQLLWDNDPPLERVPLVTPGGEPGDDQVLVSLEEFDYNLSVALVVTL